MSVCPAVPPDVMPAAAEESGVGLLGEAGIVAVRVADLHSPAGAGLGKDGRTALVTAGAGRVRTGDVVVFCKPVAIAPAVVRATGGCRPRGIRLITPAWAWPRAGWMSYAARPARSMRSRRP